MAKLKQSLTNKVVIEAKPKKSAQGRSRNTNLAATPAPSRNGAERRPWEIRPAIHRRGRSWQASGLLATWHRYEIGCGSVVRDGFNTELPRKDVLRSVRFTPSLEFNDSVEFEVV